MKDFTTHVCARVSAAPALGGTKMYKVKISCHGQSKSMYKTKDDFTNVCHMFKLVGAMAARAGADDAPCAVCASCSRFVPSFKGCDEAHLDAFLGAVLETLRKAEYDAIVACSAHRGVVQILMAFLGISDGKYFCEQRDGGDMAGGDALAAAECEHPIAPHCSLQRSLSEQFAAFDSVC